VLFGNEPGGQILAADVQLHELAMCYLFVANSRWCEDVAGRALSTVARALPVEIVAAYTWSQTSDLWTTVTALLIELEHSD